MKKKIMYFFLAIFSFMICFSNISTVKAIDNSYIKTVSKSGSSNYYLARNLVANYTDISENNITITNATTTNDSFITINKAVNDYRIKIGKSALSNLSDGTRATVNIEYTVGTNSTVQKINILFIVKDTTNSVCCKVTSGYKYASKNSCSNTVDESFCSSSNSNDSSSKDDTPSCYKYTTINATFYEWTTLSKVLEGGKATSYERLGDIKSSTECQKQATTINGSTEEPEEEVKISTTISSSNSDTGNNSCNSFIISTQDTKYGQNYELSNGGFSTKGDAYKIYKAKYNTKKCQGVNPENIRAFCIDPGAGGPNGVSYTATSKVTNKSSKTMRAIYQLYSNWYLNEENKSKIKSKGDGSDSYFDFIINSVARVILFEYPISTFKLNANVQGCYELGRHYNLFHSLSKSNYRFLKPSQNEKLINDIMDDVEKFVNSNQEIPSGENEVDFKVEASTPVLTDSNTGFEVEFLVKLKSESAKLLEAAKSSINITAATESGTNIDLSDDEKTIVEDWKEDADGYSVIKYKVFKKNAYSLLGEDNNIKVKVNIAYNSEKSIDNIVLLTPNTKRSKIGNCVVTSYQKFLTFASGNVAKTGEINIEMSKSQENTCRAAFALPCTSSDTVFYLIEGTQSGTLFNSIIGGINSIGDLRNLISNATSMVEYLKNLGQNGISLSSLKNLSSLLYNYADKIGVIKNLSNELSFLKELNTKRDNYTAGQLYNALKQVNFNGTAQENFKVIANLFSNSVLNGVANGYDKVKSEWQEIIDYSKELKISTSTKELLELIGNSINSAKDLSSLKDVFNGSKSLIDYLSQATDLEQIKSQILGFSTTLQQVITTNGSGISGILEYLDTIKSQVFNASNLGDVSSLLDGIKNGLTVNWEKCIIGEGNVEATDPNGNSYTVQTANDYCSIVCKEDYAFKMPGNLGVTYAGRYISTNLDNIYHATVGVAGQRTCVTTSVDNDKYLQEATSDKDNMLKAYNEYKKDYAFFMDLENREPVTKEVKTDPTMVDTTSIMTTLNSQLNTAIEDVTRKVISSIVGSSTSDEYLKYLSDFTSNSETLTQGILGQVGFGSLDSAKIITYFSASLEKIFSETDYKDKIADAVSSAKDEIVEKISGFAKESLTTLGGVTLETIGKGGITLLCHLGRLAKLNVVCDIYSEGSKMVENFIQTVNKGTQSSFKIFNITEGVNYNYNYDVYKYSDATNNEAKLNSEFIKEKEAHDSGKTDDDDFEGWIMESGSYILKSMHFGIYINFGNLTKGLNSFKQAYNTTSDVIGKISNTFDAIKSASGIINNPSIGSIKSLTDSSFSNKLGAGNINSLLSTLNDIFSVVDQAKSLVSSAEHDVSNMLDYVIDAYYYLRGTFDTYYNSLAEIRTEMRKQKDLYESYRTSLSQKAANMSSCTIWEKEYDMDPQITFTYGYKNNNLLDFIASKNNLTTDYITLEAINKPSEPDVSTYYCYKDIDINQIQDWNNIMDGTCVTSDGILGSILNALIDTNGAGSEIAKWFGDNKETLSQLFSNFQSIPGVKDLTDSICNSNSKLCDLFNVQSEDDVNGAVNTYIPGSLMYDLGKTITESGQLFKDASSAIVSGNLKGFENSIVKRLYVKDVNIDGYSIKYRNVKRVATVSRYGNPGVAISGVNWQSILSNVATWLSNKFGGSSSTFINKINNAISSINGQGSQEFIYYQSSQKYWTSSNKGIYTKAPTTSDSVLVDTGDEALTKTEIVTADGSTKEPNGKVYPIALSTAAGTYGYQLVFNNIGQYYNNALSLGRIVDNNGYVSGLLSNQYVCKYEVKSEPDTPNASCEDILESADCKDENGYFKDLYKNQQNYTNTNGIDYESKWNACITKLLAENDSCCYLVDSNNVPNASQDRYNSMCNSKCQGIKLIGADSAIKDSSSSNAALISKNGNLQFYTKVVSNYDFFPNGEGSKGYNWSGSTSGYENVDENGKPQPQKVSEIQKDMEEVGDNTYANDEEYLDYSIALNSACMAKIKEYNDQQELNDLGFGDYTLGSISKESRDYQSKFLKDLEENPEYASCQKAITNQLQK